MTRSRKIFCVAVVLLAFGGLPSSAQSVEKQALVIMGFESGTVSAQVQDKRGFAALIGSMHGGEREAYDPAQLGIGISDMLVDKLLDSGEFRLLDRSQTDAAKTARYIVTGSVTKFGFEEHNVGGLLASVATMGLLSYKEHKTEVTLTARVIDAATGEIVASLSGEGVSNKGGGLRVIGIGANGAGGADVSSANFRSTAIGQATGRAVNNLAAKIIEKKATFQGQIAGGSPASSP
jgi:curli biogenesis system outer membrane secretion channel CsgG